MDIHPEIHKRILKVIGNQKIAVLATSKDDEAYSCLVAFTITDDLKELVFATMRQRLKYRNIMANPRVTLTIDDRDSSESDFNDTTSITMIGTARAIRSDGRQQYISLLLNQHPSLSEFVNSPECTIISVLIDKMYIVSDFESVVKIE